MLKWMKLYGLCWSDKLVPEDSLALNCYPGGVVGMRNLEPWPSLTACLYQCQHSGLRRSTLKISVVLLVSTILLAFSYGKSWFTCRPICRCVWGYESHLLCLRRPKLRYEVDPAWSSWYSCHLGVCVNRRRTCLRQWSWVCVHGTAANLIW